MAASLHEKRYKGPGTGENDVRRLFLAVPCCQAIFATCNILFRTGMDDEKVSRRPDHEELASSSLA
jgi:hypothetical protein